MSTHKNPHSASRAERQRRQLSRWRGRTAIHAALGGTGVAHLVARVCYHMGLKPGSGSGNRCPEYTGASEPRIGADRPYCQYANGLRHTCLARAGRPGAGGAVAVRRGRPVRSRLPDGVDHFPYSREMVVVVIGDKIQMVYESHWRLQARVGNSPRKE